MQKVYSNENNFLVHNIKNLLEAESIDVFVKNEFTQGAVGEVAAFDAWPELWIVNEADHHKALAIIEAANQLTDKQEWQCAQCSEINEPSFDICWHCQTEKPLK